LSDFEYLYLFREYSPPNFEVARNRAKFCMFWPLNFFRGTPLEILIRRYKIKPSTDLRAKFHASRPMHLGDLALKKNKTFAVKLESAPQAIASGRTKKHNRQNVEHNIYIMNSSATVTTSLLKVTRCHNETL